jgi:GT2 family glycosyltransferase
MQTKSSSIRNAISNGEIDLSIIIINYNTKDLTLCCLESLFRYIPAFINFEIFVVDNASIDDSLEELEKIKKSHSNLHIIACNNNLGFGAANNKALFQVKGRNTLLLNNDTYLIDDSILEAINWIDAHPHVFGCGCRLLNSDLSNGISYGYFPELCTVFLEVCTFRPNFRRGIVPDKNDFTTHPVNFVMAAFYLIKTEFLMEMNGFDETFFMYFEDVDLARRAMKLGLETFYFGKTQIVHLAGGSSKKKIPSKQKEINQYNIMFYESWRYYLEKHCSKFEVAIIYVFIALDLYLRYCRAVILFGSRKSIKWKNLYIEFKQGWHAIDVENPIHGKQK